MRKTFLPFTLFSLACIALAQDHQSEPVLSKDPLTTEQIAVYRAVLNDYVRGSGGELNVADRTSPLRGFMMIENDECLKGTKFELPPATKPVVHKLDPAVTLGPGMVLVDPEQQNKQQNETNPDHLINALSTDLFTLSEITFDESHTHAMVAYSFNCGILCGHGYTVLLTKVPGAWLISGKCGGWES